MKNKKLILKIDEEQRDLLILALSNLQIAMFDELMEEEKNRLINSYIVEWDNQMPTQQERTLFELQDESITQPIYCFTEAHEIKLRLMNISSEQQKNSNSI